MLIKFNEKYIRLTDVILFLFFSIYLVGSGQHNKKFLFILFTYLLILNIKNIVPVLQQLLRNWPFILVIIWCFATSFWSI